MTIAFAQVSESDFDALVAMRIAAMRESLERVGRFDPDRARERLRQTFTPAHTRMIYANGERVGFYALRPISDWVSLDHLYVMPAFQRRGIGTEVVRMILAEADRQTLPVKVGALKESASNRFYQRHGFVCTGVSEWDVYYERLPASG